MKIGFESAQQVADAVLYEGYVLYPYRASSDKNRVRFQFGVVAPRAYAEADGSEAWQIRTEGLLRPTSAEARVDVRLRFLRLQARTVQRADPEAQDAFREVDRLTDGDETWLPWDEAVEEHADVSLLVDGPRVERRIVLPGGRDEELLGAGDRPVGRLTRTRLPIEARLVVDCEHDGRFRRICAVVENVTAYDDFDAGRDAALRRSLLGCHVMLAVEGGRWVSLTDPPADAADAASRCRNERTWPVVVGAEATTLLSSPIILPDHPEIAPESPGDLFDATEIDEILTLRVMTLTDEEKRDARATDPRARRIVERADTMPPELMDKLHGAIRYLRGAPAGRELRPEPAPRDEPAFPTLMTNSDGTVLDLPASVWQPEARIAPELASITVRGTAVTRGSSVRLVPVRRADSMDHFLIGRTATVEAIFESVDDETFVAVTVDDDPATELHREAGRYFYFQPDELEPVL
jgi:hypothetical protein